MENKKWSGDLQPSRIRIARQTDQLAAINRFYCEGLGLPVLSTFEGHAGYDGLILGLPDQTYQLEFVQHVDGSPGMAPSKENLLVFYLPDTAAVKRIAQRLISMGYAQVPSENPWWDEHDAITIEDPDQWRIVLQPSPEIED